MNATRLDLLQGERATKQSELDRIVATPRQHNRKATAGELARAQALSDEIRGLDDEIRDTKTALQRAEISDQAAVRSGEVGKVESVSRAVVTREARTYSPHKDERGEASFFVDAFQGNLGDVSATQRLNRHMQEARVEGELQLRATTTSSFAGLVVPQYLVEKAALVARAGRPFASSVLRVPLPEQGTQFQIPRGTTGASAAIQASENTNVSNTDEVWANLTLNVATIAGQQDVSRQSLERGTPGLDSLIYMDLAGAYMAALDAQTISGSGSSGQVLGVLNTSGINQATAFTAAATASTFYAKVAGQISAISSSRFLPPDSIAMHPRRWAWLSAQVDSQGRPLALPNDGGPVNAMATHDGPAYGPAGQFLGLDVYTDANLPTSVGTGPEDQVLVYRSDDIMLFEDGDGMPRQLRFEQTLGAQLTVKLVAYGYAAFTAGRYPTAVGVVGGNAGTAGYGLVAPTF